MLMSTPSRGHVRAGRYMYRCTPSHSPVVCRAAQNEQAVAPTSSDTAIEQLKVAAGKIKSVDKVAPKDVFKYLRLLQKANLKGEWGPMVGCDEYWRLVYTANSQAMKANNQNPEDGTGYFFPAVATNKLTLTGPDSGEMKTATYLPHIAAVEFSGKYNVKGKLTNFDMENLKVKLGPFTLGPFSIPSQVKDGKGPFFNFFYADEDIACAVGRSGGIAMWAKAEPTFIAEKGLMI